MALTTSKSINLSGQSVINGVTVETYTASCSEANPKTMYIQQSTTNQELRKENRTQCRKDRDEFRGACICYAGRDDSKQRTG